jgi:hypothetical protein
VKSLRRVNQFSLQTNKCMRQTLGSLIVVGWPPMTAECNRSDLSAEADRTLALLEVGHHLES